MPSVYLLSFNNAFKEINLQLIQVLSEGTFQTKTHEEMTRDGNFLQMAYLILKNAQLWLTIRVTKFQSSLKYKLSGLLRSYESWYMLAPLRCYVALKFDILTIFCLLWITLWLTMWRTKYMNIIIIIRRCEVQKTTSNLW